MSRVCNIPKLSDEVFVFNILKRHADFVMTDNIKVVISNDTTYCPLCFPTYPFVCVSFKMISYRQKMISVSIVKEPSTGR